MKQIVYQSDFTGGEISPNLYGRVDLDLLKKGLKTATNVYLRPQGPVRRRNGSKFIKSVKTSSAVTRLVAFNTSATTGYVLEFGNTYIRFFKDQANIESGGSPYEVTTPYSTADVQELQFTQLGSTLYIAHRDHQPRALTVTSDASWSLSTLNFNPPPVKELGDKPAATLTPAATTGTGVNFTAGSSVPFQAGDVGRQLKNLTGNGRAIITAITSGTVVVCDIVEDFPSTSAIASQGWMITGSPIAELNITAGPVGKIGERMTITSEDTASVGAQASFRSGDVGKYLRFSGGLCKIITYTSSSVVNVEVVAALDNVTKTTSFTLEQAIWSASLGWPGTIEQYQQRLVFGGTDSYPQTVWLSTTGVYDLFAGGSQATDSLEFTPASRYANNIEWIAFSDDLIIGTSGAEFKLGPGEGAGTALTPDSADGKLANTYGSAPQYSVQSIGSNIIFEQRDGKTLRAWSFDYNKSRYIGGELTFVAEHIAKEGIGPMAYAQYPDSLLHVVLDSGDLLVGTYLPDLKEPILGWTRYTTEGTYESVVTVNVSGGTEVWVIAKRTINGSTVRYIEVFDSGNGESNTDGFVDSYLTYSNPLTITNITKANPAVVTITSHGLNNGDIVRIRDVGGMTELNGRTFTVANKTANTFELSGENSTSYTTYTSGGSAYKQVTTISGLSHLEAATVSVLTDGAVHPDVTVSSGAITLDYACSEVVVGLAYSSEVETLPANFQTNLGQMDGQQVRWVKPRLKLYKSGKPLMNGNYVPSRGAQDHMDYKLDLFTGNVEYGPLGWGTDTVTVTYDDPLPLEIQAIFGTIDSGVA